MSLVSRSITSFAKVQSWTGYFIRNRTFQLRRNRVRELRYLDIGCGRNCHPEFVNMDYQWHPEVDICWDIGRELPFASGAMKGIFSEHCLEHFPIPAGIGILRECRRVLGPGGILRLVVPDGELYLSIYCRQIAGDDQAHFPYQTDSGLDGFVSPILHVNRVFYQDRESLWGHCAMYDFHLLERLLQHAGFVHVRRCSFREGDDPVLLVDSEPRECESLYVEATA